MKTIDIFDLQDLKSIGLGPTCSQNNNSTHNNVPRFSTVDDTANNKQKQTDL